MRVAVMAHPVFILIVKQTINIDVVQIGLIFWAVQSKRGKCSHRQFRKSPHQVVFVLCGLQQTDDHFIFERRQRFLL